jgi:hypothetical protein
MRSWGLATVEMAFAQPSCVTLFAVTTFNSSQPLPDCNMNKLVFVPPLASHPLVGYKHEGAYFLAHDKQRVGDENLGHATWVGWAWLESRG